MKAGFRNEYFSALLQRKRNKSITSGSIKLVYFMPNANPDIAPQISSQRVQFVSLQNKRADKAARE